MPVPKKRSTKSKVGKRRSQKKLKRVENLRPCPRCKAPILPHKKCQFCGYYSLLRKSERRRISSG